MATPSVLTEYKMNYETLEEQTVGTTRLVFRALREVQGWILGAQMGLNPALVVEKITEELEILDRELAQLH